MTCLTILLDPGRLKRGVDPDRMLGPPLRAGQRYTLAVGPGMIDAHGRPLREGFSKPSSVSEAVREPVAIERWTIRPPEKGSRQPLELIFPTQLDWAQPWRGITVASGSGRPITGRGDTSIRAKRDGASRQRHLGRRAPIASASRQVLKTSAGTPHMGHSMGRFDQPMTAARGHPLNPL
jgi:hypothetical protein